MMRQEDRGLKPAQVGSAQAYSVWYFRGFHNQNASGVRSLSSIVSVSSQIY